MSRYMPHKRWRQFQNLPQYPLLPLPTPPPHPPPVHTPHQGLVPCSKKYYPSTLTCWQCRHSGLVPRGRHRHARDTNDDRSVGRVRSRQPRVQHTRARRPPGTALIVQPSGRRQLPPHVCRLGGTTVQGPKTRCELTNSTSGQQRSRCKKTRPMGGGGRNSTNLGGQKWSVACHGIVLRASTPRTPDNASASSQNSSTRQPPGTLPATMTAAHTERRLVLPAVRYLRFGAGEGLLQV